MLTDSTCMEHINPKPGHIDFGRYRTYLESVREQLPAHVYAFASNPCHFDLESHSSLHDAWLESLAIRETASGMRREVRRIEIDVCLRGPFHDRRIHLNYMGVWQYSFVAPPCSGWDVHGDLFIHEIRSSGGGRFVHELEFRRGATFMIECSDLRHSEEMLESAT